MPCVNGCPATSSNFRQADEVRIEVQGSKTDVYNKGEFRNHFSNDKPNFGERFCVVEAIIILFAHALNRFLGSEAHEPLLVDEDGQQISREVIQMLLTSRQKTLVLHQETMDHIRSGSEWHLPSGPHFMTLVL